MTKLHENGEALPSIFRDSWERLGWVKSQTDLVKTLCGPLIGMPRQAFTKVAIDDSVSVAGRFVLDVDVLRFPTVSKEVNFLVGDIVTNARSCLDMAVESIWRHYNLPRKGTMIQFPLEDQYHCKPPRKREVRLAKFLERLHPMFVRVIAQAQPDYEDGMLDIPVNFTALAISHLSNANKHRNITPVVMDVSLFLIGTRDEGLVLTNLGGNSEPPVRLVLEYDVERYSEDTIRTFIEAIPKPRSSELLVGINQRLRIDGQSIPLQRQGMKGQPVDKPIDWPVEFEGLIENVPAYVNLVLTNLERAHKAIQSGDTDVFFNIDRTL